MSTDSRRLSRDRLAFCGWLALSVACTAPDSNGLFSPTASSAGGSSAGAGGNRAEVDSEASAVGVAAGGAGVTPAEGQGGTLSLAGAGGATNGGNAGERVEDDAPAPAPVAVDAGVPADAGPPPAACSPSAEVCDGIDSDCDGVIDQGQTCRSGCTGFVLADHGYMFCADPVDRAVALARCAAQNMKLAWLETPAENAAVVARIGGLDVASDGAELIVQMGASDDDDEDEWFWTGSAAVSGGFQFWRGNAADDDDAGAVGGAYQNWAAGEPNDLDDLGRPDGEDCGVMSITGSEFRGVGEWDDRNCLVELPFVCEAP